MSVKNNFSISNTTKGKLPRLPFKLIKEATLGNDYELSLVFTTPTHSKKLNKTYRGKNSATDILSFPLEDKKGEIFICLAETKKEASKFDRPYENFILFLFIHGLVHLKGFDHGSRMESEEKKIRRIFGV